MQIKSMMVTFRYLCDERNLFDFMLFIGNKAINFYNKNLLFNIFMFIPVHCQVCYNNHNKYDYYKKCISSTLSDVVNIYVVDIYGIDTNKIIKSILSYLNIYNNCKKCNHKIKNWYKQMDICDSCDIVLCSRCIKNQTIQTTPPGIFIYFLIFLSIININII